MHRLLSLRDRQRFLFENLTVLQIDQSKRNAWCVMVGVQDRHSNGDRCVRIYLLRAFLISRRSTLALQ
ncbi:hypothetical protein BRM22_19415 [Xanthomonas oryzae pv. oryzae]|uniref:Uncharacterized protein n=1 Tax=Xanthomonas oryzae pv. oryzae TaxID=64187 RepID=A0A854CMK2_XANOO|nr:hypothetical protein BXO6_14970 [Xanthomonas oryzae pv. oryzae]OLG31816.1 hypothetical protein BXO2_17715 [Xanthomonas oryzae pv. oryzae]OLG43706.1 hypothetical protein BXO33_13490 [Xanthomonas oryzae pv. oryzae]OLG53887.1 hypothetical protein BXO34_11315 [Xanthomonas oryzae pv. oryzae]OLG56187.1 hypothetical protein BXO407_18585 [Xanthomonas oryzae pv. oryzae]